MVFLVRESEREREREREKERENDLLPIIPSSRFAPELRKGGGGRHLTNHSWWQLSFAISNFQLVLATFVFATCYVD